MTLPFVLVAFLSDFFLKIENGNNKLELSLEY